MTSILLLVVALAAPGDDWPQFLGPTRDGVYAGPAVSTAWGTADSKPAGPPVLWKRPAESGYAGPVLSGGKLVLFHREKGEEVIECLEADSGKSLWSVRSATGYQNEIGTDDSGPRATPAIEGGRVYTLGAEGKAHAVDLATGAVVWKADLRERHGAELSYFGLACSPLVEGDAVLLNVGGKDGAAIVALKKSSGELLWKALDDREPSYSSPIAADIGGKRRAVFFTRSGLAALDPATGTVAFRFPWRARSNTTVNAAAPLVSGGRIFITASYGTGAACLDVKGDRVEPVWTSDDVLSCHFSTPVLVSGLLYGFHGREEYGTSLRCVDLASGKVAWEEPRLGPGSITAAGDKLLALTEEGELVIARASREKFTTLARARILDEGPVRAHPALVGGRLYVKGPRTLLCLDLRAPSGPGAAKPGE